MSDVMLLGVLRMPYDLAMQDAVSRFSFHSRASAAADRIEADADELARLRAEVERLTAALSDERAHADALAELVADQIETETEFWTVWDEQAAQAIQRHRARRQG